MTANNETPKGFIYLHPSEGFTFLENVPEKPWQMPLNMDHIGQIIWREVLGDYERALAEAIEKRIVIGNPEMVSYKDGDWHCWKHDVVPNHADKFIKEGELYPWPGTYTIKEEDTVEDGGGCYVAGSRTFVILLPQKEDQELKDAIIGQETLALDLFRCMDLLNRCYWNMLTHAPSDKTMSHAEWMDCLNELELFRTEHPPTKFANVKKPEPVVSQDQEESQEEIWRALDNMEKFNLSEGLSRLHSKISARTHFTITRKPID